MDDHEAGETILPRLYERDVDVLLQEEILFNPVLRRLLLSKVGLADLAPKRCALSVVHETGETDILAVFSSELGEAALLIEDKIDAEFQEQQPERYSRRVHALIENSAFSEAKSLLVAPERYLQSAKEACAIFNGYISYEAIAEAIRAENSPRAAHRAALLLRAVDQARSAYTMEPVEEVCTLWQRIFDIAINEFPALAMKPPGKKGAYSTWITFKGDLPAKVTIDWKITSGVIDLSFWKSAAVRPCPNIDLKTIAPAALGKAGETIVIRLPVPVGGETWISLSDEDIRTALGAAQRLLHFYRDNPLAFV